MLGRFGIGAHGEPAVVGVAREAGPELLAVDHVLVAVEIRARGERGEVGAGARLAVADAEVDLAGEDLRQEERLLLLAAVARDRRADRVGGEHRHRRAAAHRFVEEDELLDLGAALPAVLRGPSDPEPAVGAHLTHDLAVVRTDAVLGGRAPRGPPA